MHYSSKKHHCKKYDCHCGKHDCHKSDCHCGRHDCKKHDHKKHDYHCGKHDCKKHDTCIRKTLQDIVYYQNKQSEQEEYRCKSGCQRAIHELLNPVQQPKNTIPIMLYMKDGCPFKGEGCYTTSCSCCNKKIFSCISSFVFRVSDIKHDCVLLELLTINKHEECDCGCSCEICSPSEQLDSEKVKDLKRTGICIKMDIDCFCGISCLPPVNLPKHGKKYC